MTPVVFAIGKEYEIAVPVSDKSLMWVEVGGKKYYDHCNGILRSEVSLHKMRVPAGSLDEAGEYSVCYRKIVDRKPYFSETEEVVRETFYFRPYIGGDLCIYHIADTHSYVEDPVNAGKAFADQMNLLILNGDIPDSSQKIEYVNTIYEIAGKLTKGELPVIFSRGNHDMRGMYAEKFAEYTPTQEGRSYYTVRIGDLWAIVLDAGEDKADEQRAYGHTICCHDFRCEETAFINQVIANADEEYNAPGVEKRIVICHNPFTCTYSHPFDIEQQLYADWVKMIRENICPDFYVAGHLHKYGVIMPGSEKDSFNQGSPVIIGAEPSLLIADGEICGMQGFVGCAIQYEKDDICVLFTNQEGITLEKVHWSRR